MESTINVKLDMSGIKPIEKACNYLNSRVAQSGVIDADSETMYEAEFNAVKGGQRTYDSGPFAGETVDVPVRPFIDKPVELFSFEIFEKAVNVLKGGLTEQNAEKALEVLGEESSKKQRDTLYNNGAWIPGWVEHNDPRTVATKGFDQPLWSRRGETFPISYEVVKK